MKKKTLIISVVEDAYERNRRRPKLHRSFGSCLRTRCVLMFHTVLIVAAMAACTKHDDFDFAGTVVDYEECNGISEMGYAVALTSPSDIGREYTTRSGDTYANVMVIYGSDRILKENAKISGRIYIDNNYSKTTCSRHYTDRDVPEGVFTKLKKE